jgi:peptide deformylase
MKLVDENDPVLKAITAPYDWEKEPKPEYLIMEMMKTMFQNGGIGLAAPQVGIAKRIFVMGTPEKSYACINPEIISGEGEIKEIEGCLSYPGLYLHVKRFEKIKVKYQNILGETKEEEFDGIMARCFQHELDHLNGVCFVEKVANLSLKMAQARRKKIKKQLG